MGYQGDVVYASCGDNLSPGPIGHLGLPLEDSWLDKYTQCSAHLSAPASAPAALTIQMTALRPHCDLAGGITGAYTDYRSSGRAGCRTCDCTDGHTFESTSDLAGSRIGDCVCYHAGECAGDRAGHHIRDCTSLTTMVMGQVTALVTLLVTVLVTLLVTALVTLLVTALVTLLVTAPCW
ncbi:hypothetical protein NDU88_001347 [Pleurodeles waltl]|uniref:Uncharacterized protein n=1 Tax=Pleurodeles waltl TaxID=8319 RepID=A0AAV7RA18_PLEWA|nr:hypothetical protein NDU88_001347 [Pleurodeles waltl]